MNKSFHKGFHKACSTFVGVIAMVLLATAFGAAQSDQPLPFPQAANPALTNPGPDTDSQPAVLPPAMASPNSTKNTEAGSPFPMAANPSQGADWSDLHATCSLCPCAPNPTKD